MPEIGLFGSEGGATTHGVPIFVDTVGRDTETIRKYIAEQEMEDRRLDQLEMPEITRE